MSVVYEYTNLFDYLLENEASPTLGASWKGNDTPLNLACAKGNEYMVKRLIDVGVSPNIVNNMGQTPLHYAAWHEQSRIVELLVGYGANIDAMSRRNETADTYTQENCAT
ncbi:MAG: ankyrin repeat domain-containing protein [Kiritimatiellae bacterium]|nr:ankyrin repeat domain-containing protein [Kiritimatiellia bacterium]